MSPITVTGIVFACIFGGAMIAMILGRALPEPHLRPDSKDPVKQGLAMIATLAALVLGLLVAAAKGSYDTQTAAIKRAMMPKASSRSMRRALGFRLSLRSRRICRLRCFASGALLRERSVIKRCSLR
jgi:hypothetical protein